MFLIMLFTKIALKLCSTEQNSNQYQKEEERRRFPQYSCFIFSWFPLQKNAKLLNDRYYSQVTMKPYFQIQEK